MHSLTPSLTFQHFSSFGFRSDLLCVCAFGLFAIPTFGHLFSLCFRMNFVGLLFFIKTHTTHTHTLHHATVVMKMKQNQTFPGLKTNYTIEQIEIKTEELTEAKSWKLDVDNNFIRKCCVDCSGNILILRKKKWNSQCDDMCIEHVETFVEIAALIMKFSIIQINILLPNASKI